MLRAGASKLLRRNLASAPPQLLHFSSHYSSFPNSSHSLVICSSCYTHRQHDYTNWCSATLHPLSHHDRLSFSRRFSTWPDTSELGEPFLPVRVLISLLDSYHDITGFPWWIIISSSTVALRLAIFPVIVLQLKKLRKIGDLLPKLPPPFPPPLSGRSFRHHFGLFWKEKKAAGCPSFLWFFASFAVQVPSFFLWIMSVRRMSLDQHPGFDCGGTLWFQNLTEYPHGLLGPIIPLFIAGLHFVNIQISFRKSSLQNLRGSLGLLAKLYRNYLELLTLPILFGAFNVPQGSSVYWLTNSSLSLIQMLCLSHPDVLEYLGLPKKNASVAASANIERGNSGVADIVLVTEQGEIPAQSLSPEELVSFSIKILTDGGEDAAIRLLRLALKKDPGYVRALVIMGQIFFQNKQFAEATKCLERGISKLVVDGYPTEGEEVDLLILSSQWAGIANVQQGKMEEGLVHLERIAQLQEPVDSKSKEHYYDGLVILASALVDMGRKAEALNYMQKAAAYKSAYNKYLGLYDTYSKDIASDLASSRRDI